ncbi:hypothetical protein K6M90_23095 [Rhizobium sp. 9T]|uniref:hypothetical protein n=1 Tax=Rhizobium croatiense TaxID=2867516 RepID=UPI001C935682|nr:hypothetical protein [Rhizobium croatiense]MBY4610531.1 hypothetical protein [Rhizobium croatiense]
MEKFELATHGFKKSFSYIEDGLDDRLDADRTNAPWCLRSGGQRSAPQVISKGEAACSPAVLKAKQVPSAPVASAFIPVQLAGLLRFATRQEQGETIVFTVFAA